MGQGCQPLKPIGVRILMEAECGFRTSDKAKWLKICFEDHMGRIVACDLCFDACNISDDIRFYTCIVPNVILNGKRREKPLIDSPSYKTKFNIIVFQSNHIYVKCQEIC